MRWTTLDGALMGFDRERGHNVLHVSDATRRLVRRAPRTLQVGLLTPCNLSCHFCYRDRQAPSLLDASFVVDLLQKAARWGVLEVAFGGGEPLLFKGFADVIDELHRTTTLGLNLTTNGMLLSPELMQRLRGKVSEFRLSAYPDNHWRATLERYRGEPMGLNWLVTPQNVHEVVPRVEEAFALGAQNVLLLGYKGSDESLALRDEDVASLRRSLRALDGLPLLLDICLYPRLADLPHLFRRDDCGAGDDMLAITADRAVQACSFSDRRISFETFEDLQSIWSVLRAARPSANVGGCTRDEFSKAPVARVASGRVLPVLDDDRVSRTWHWRARASSNSGPFTILARFKDVETAEQLETMLDDVYQAHLDYIVEQSVEERSAVMYEPTPPMIELGNKHGFTWPQGFAWEGDAFGDRGEADSLEIERFGTNLIVYLGYGQELGGGGIEHLCAMLGAETIVAGDAFRVTVAPKTPKADAAIADILELADDSYLGFDSARTDNVEELANTEFQIEARLSSGTRMLGFVSTIGGLGTASDLVVRLSGVRDAEFRMRGGRKPRRLGTPWQDTPIEPLDAPSELPPSPASTPSAQSGARRFELTSGTSNKFWEVEVAGTSVITRYGRIGNAPRATEKRFDTPELARAHAEKLVVEKTKKGYGEAGA